MYSDVCVCLCVCLGVCHFFVYISFLFCKWAVKDGAPHSVPGSNHSGDFARPLYFLIAIKHSAVVGWSLPLYSSTAFTLMDSFPFV